MRVTITPKPACVTRDPLRGTGHGRDTNSGPDTPEVSVGGEREGQFIPGLTAGCPLATEHRWDAANLAASVAATHLPALPQLTRRRGRPGNRCGWSLSPPPAGSVQLADTAGSTQARRDATPLSIHAAGFPSLIRLRSWWVPAHLGCSCIRLRIAADRQRTDRSPLPEPGALAHSGRRSTPRHCRCSHTARTRSEETKQPGSCHAIPARHHCGKESCHATCSP